MVRKLSLVFALLVAPVAARLQVTRRSCDKCVQEFSDLGGCDDDSAIQPPIGCDSCQKEAAAQCAKIQKEEEENFARRTAETQMRAKETEDSQTRELQQAAVVEKETVEETVEEAVELSAEDEEKNEEKQFTDELLKTEPQSCHECAIQFAIQGGCEDGPEPAVPPQCRACGPEVNDMCDNMEADAAAGLGFEEGEAMREKDKAAAAAAGQTQQKVVQDEIQLRQKKAVDNHEQEDQRKAVVSENPEDITTEQCIACAQEFYSSGGCNEHSEASPPEGCASCDSIAEQFCKDANSKMESLRAESDEARRTA